MQEKFIFFLILFWVTTLHVVLFNIEIDKKAPNISTKKEKKIIINLLTRKTTSIVTNKTIKKETKKEKKIIKKASYRATPTLHKKRPHIHHKIVKKTIKKDNKKIEKKIIKSSEPKKLPLQNNKAKLPTKKEIKKAPQKEETFSNKTSPKATIPQNKNISNIQTKKDIKNIERKYLKYIKELIKNNIKYPRRARRLKKQGIVYLSFNINKDGTITKINVEKSSGSKILDKSAIKTIKKIKKFKKIPNELKRNSWNIKIPMVYKLR